MEITKNILIEDLVEKYPVSIDYLSKQGIRCIRCGEPIWGSLEQAAKEKGFDDDEIKKFVEELIVLSKK
ncbi:MAG: DUF1858 domain-containing protein [Bacteroidales bacterium]|nr:DUF1858 domain-containing protein [Bacteroidales bacterium]MCK9498730.1 DUF1858 domain-containing protein [Bacteroidales bacterium]MDY0313797.1 DUF1858 domain-containing protein [Bacteroidales bacterium]NLB85848.1 DUF1858 domain-containing protein [Bacteroidales bacterium]